MAPNQRHWTEERRLMPTFAMAAERRMASRVILSQALLRNYYARPVIARADAMVNTDRPTSQMAMWSALGNMGFNLTREVVDASAAQHCVPLRTHVTPVGADWKVTKACKDLQRLDDGIKDAIDFMLLKQLAFKDCATTDLAGYTKFSIDPQTKEIIGERADPLYLFDDESGYERFEYAAVPKIALARRYPQHASKIQDAPTWDKPAIIGVSAPIGGGRAEKIKVITGWCLGDSGNPGMMSMQLADGTELEFDEDDGMMMFPFGQMKWDHDYGDGSVSLARVLAPYHAWTNRLVLTYYKSLRGAVPRVMLHENSEVDAVTDEEFERVVWSGQIEPTIKALQTVPPDVPAAIEALRTRSFAEGGISPTYAAGMKPSGVISAPGQREAVDIASMRSRGQQLNVERYDVQCTKVINMLACRAYRTKAARVKAPGTKMLQEIKFPNLKESQYQISVLLASGLSATYAGKVEQLNDIRSNAPDHFTQADYLRALNIPDTATITDQVNAPLDLADEMIAMAIEGTDDRPDGEFVMPMSIPELLDAIVKKGEMELQRTVRTAPRENWDCLRRLVLAAKAKMPKPAPLPLPPMAGPGGAPPPGMPPAPMAA